MKEIHPLKRKSIKPSSSTIRGMLPGPQFRALDAAMQSLRSAGMRLEWQWKSKSIGWVCVGMLEDIGVCELRPTQEPLIGVIVMTHEQKARALSEESIINVYKAVLRIPIEETKNGVLYEFVLESTEQRALFSEFVESLETVLVN